LTENDEFLDCEDGLMAIASLLKGYDLLVFGVRGALIALIFPEHLLR